jgi:hypothetical protein
MTLAMLSWGAHRTLRNTLESYRRYGLDATDSDKIIFFQEMSMADVDIAMEFGWDAIGDDENIGIAAAYRALVDEARGDLFMFLENDWELVESDPTPHLKAAQHLLYSGVVDCVRLRSRSNPGHPLWTLQFQGKEWERPTHLLDAVHWTDDPTTLGLKKINFSMLNGGEQTFYHTTAKQANWTNNPTIMGTEFIRKFILPVQAGGDLERDIQGWWEQQDFIVAQGEGLFSHNRLD